MIINYCTDYVTYVCSLILDFTSDCKSVQQHEDQIKFVQTNSIAKRACEYEINLKCISASLQ